MKYIIIFLVLSSVCFAGETKESPFANNKTVTDVVLKHNETLKDLEVLLPIAKKYKAFIEWKEKKNEIRDRYFEVLKKAFYEAYMKEDWDFNGATFYCITNTEGVLVPCTNKEEWAKVSALNDAEKMIDEIINIRIGKCPPNPFKE